MRTLRPTHHRPCIAGPCRSWWMQHGQCGWERHKHTGTHDPSRLSIPSRPLPLAAAGHILQAGACVDMGSPGPVDAATKAGQKCAPSGSQHKSPHSMPPVISACQYAMKNYNPYRPHTADISHCKLLRCSTLAEIYHAAVCRVIDQMCWGGHVWHAAIEGIPRWYGQSMVASCSEGNV